MSNQQYQKLKIEFDDLEWLYVPDEVYADYDGCKRCLQLFIPYRQKLAAEETFPLVLFIPGSAWYHQELYNSLPAYSRLAERGIVTAILRFRESTIAPFPAQVEDAKAALRFLAARAEDYHIDTERICSKEPLPPGFPENFRPTRDLLGVKEVLESPELAEAASCGKYISEAAELPPVLLFHGIDDVQVSVEHSRELYGLLKGAGKDVVYYELEGGGHGGAVFWTDRILDIMETFIKQKRL